jgi:hypothetical protein
MGSIWFPVLLIGTAVVTVWLLSLLPTKSRAELDAEFEQMSDDEKAAELSKNAF